MQWRMIPHFHRCTAGFQSPRCPLMGWSGRAPAPPAGEAGKGRQRRGARHVAQAQFWNRRDRYRYRQETRFTWWGTISAGRAGGRERKRSTAGRRLGSFAGTGGPRNLARIVDGAARPTRPRQGVGADRAAIGREFSHPLLAAVVCKPEAGLQTALDRLISAGLLLRQGGAPYATYSFKHVLVRDAAYSTLLREPRRALHARIAETLESQFAEISESQPELIACHYREADDVAKAVGYLSIAGDRALSHSALKEAHEHITQALQLISGLPDDDIRRRGELKLQTAFARTLQEQKGYADRQVGEAYTKAREFSKRVGDVGMHLAALYGLWAYHYLSGQPAAMLEQANEFLAFAERKDETGPIMVGYRLVGTSRLINGYIAEASDALHQALVRYDPAEHGAASPIGRSLRARFGQDVGVTMYSYRAWALWLSGQPADAEKAAESELERGRALGHDDQSRFYALWHAGMTYVLLRNVDKVAEIGNKLTELANDRQLPYWQALGDFLCGWRATRAGRAGDAVGLLQEGLRLWAQTGSRIFCPICLAFLADAYAADDTPDLAHRTFEEALRIA